MTRTLCLTLATVTLAHISSAAIAQPIDTSGVTSPLSTMPAA